MRKALLAGLASLILAAGTLPLAASAGEISNRLGDEQARINAGVQNGQLGPRAAARLQGRLNAIKAERDRNLSRHGGRLTSNDVQRLNAQENELSSQIDTSRHYRR